MTNITSSNITASPEKLPLTSIDLTEALLTRLYEEIPQVFSEGKLDSIKLHTVLNGSAEDISERYGLTWAGKQDAFRHVQVPSIATLRPHPEESIEWDSTENLIIEGDNLEVLKLLQKSYHGKVKMIYIDPPYNTGNEFIYPDNFREGLGAYLRYTGQISSEGTPTSTNKDTSGRYHSNWLNMMYPRLFLARNLLSEDGVIFISINDVELSNLRLMMDELYGNEAFIGVLVWKSRHNVDSRNKTGLSSDHEYVVCYGRKLNGQHIDETKYANPDNDSRGAWMSDNMVGLATREQRPNLHYDLVNPDTGIIYICPEKGWRYNRTTMAKKIEENRVLWPSSPSGRPRHKKFLADIRSELTGFSSLLNVPTTATGTQEIRELFNEAVFDFPKPKGLLKELIKQGMTSDGNDLLLDFFAGSGTASDAIFDLNREDDGNRKFILVQLPEKTGNPQYPTIAHITRERARRVIANLNNTEAGKLDIGEETVADRGFRAFTLDSSNFQIWQADAVLSSVEALAKQLSLYTDNLKPDRSDEDRLYELILKSGLPLSSQVERIAFGDQSVFSIAGGNLIICLEQHLTRDFLRALFDPTLESNRPVPQMVLCLDTGFDGNDSLKTNTVLEAQSHGITFRTV